MVFRMLPASNQFLRDMGDSNIVMFTFGKFLFKISIEGFVPVADVFSCINQGISQISGTTLLHVRIARFQLSGLIIGRRYAGVSRESNLEKSVVGALYEPSRGRRNEPIHSILK